MQEPSFRYSLLRLGYLQSLLSPQALYPFMIDLPALNLKQRRDAPVTLPAILARQPDNISPEDFFIVLAIRHMTLYRTAEIKYSAGAAFRYA